MHFEPQTCQNANRYVGIYIYICTVRPVISLPRSYVQTGSSYAASIVCTSGYHTVWGTLVTTMLAGLLPGPILLNF